MATNNKRIRFSSLPLMLGGLLYYGLGILWILWPYHRFPVLLLGAVLHSGLFVFTLVTRRLSYINGTAAIYFIGLSLLYWFEPHLRPLIVRYLHAGVYFSLALGATLIPPALDLEYLTEPVSRVSQPMILWDFPRLKTLNGIMNYIWLGLFIISGSLGLLRSEWAAFTAPVVFLSISGIIIAITLPRFLTRIRREETVRRDFSTMSDFFRFFPLAYTPGKLYMDRMVIQFRFYDAKEINGYLIMSKRECQWQNGDSQKPNLIISIDSADWLDIVNGRLDAETALLDGILDVEGDASLLPRMFEWFVLKEDLGSPKLHRGLLNFSSSGPSYPAFPGKTPKTVTFFDGGFRSGGISKSSFLARAFEKGLNSGGCETRYISLKDRNIEACTGCLTCWSETPGVCIFRDDMDELLKLERESDVVAFVTPLYQFSMTSTLKKYLDRRIQMFRPQVERMTGGHYTHQRRDTENRTKGFLVFSASERQGTSGPFRALSETWRVWSEYEKDWALFGEFYLPCSELFLMPAYEQWRKRVEQLCREAGEEFAKTGKIRSRLMKELRRPVLKPDTYENQTNRLWNALEEEEKNLKDFFDATRLEN